MHELFTKGRVGTWNDIGIKIELHEKPGESEPFATLIMTPERAEEIAQKLIDLAAQFKSEATL
jgi:hypothetical protein